MKYPSHDDYRMLYSRYLAENGRPVADLVDLAGPLQDKSVVDLCGGAGEIALEALERGAKDVAIVDQEISMVSLKALKSLRLSIYPFSMDDWLISHYDKYDVAYCRQAVNYWLTDHTAEKLSGRLNSGGKFIFNTFNSSPGDNPKIKKYEMNGKEYLEVSWTAKKMVRHVQWCTGMEPHYTEFRWISRKKFMEMLSPYFEVKIETDGATDIYYCLKKQ